MKKKKRVHKRLGAKMPEGFINDHSGLGGINFIPHMYKLIKIHGDGDRMTPHVGRLRNGGIYSFEMNISVGYTVQYWVVCRDCQHSYICSDSQHLLGVAAACLN